MLFLLSQPWSLRQIFSCPFLVQPSSVILFLVQRTISEAAWWWEQILKKFGWAQSTILRTQLLKDNAHISFLVPPRLQTLYGILIQLRALCLELWSQPSSCLGRVCDWRGSNPAFTSFCFKKKAGSHLLIASFSQSYPSWDCLVCKIEMLPYLSSLCFM